MDSFSRTNDSKWLSQFGLYRYQSTNSKKPKYRQISFIIYGIFGVASIVVFATFFIIIVQSNLNDKTIIVTNPQQGVNDSYNPTTILIENDDMIIRDEQLEPLHNDDEVEFLIGSNINDTVFFDEDDDDGQVARNNTIDDFDEYDSSDGSGGSEVIEDLDKISAEKLTLAESDFVRRPPRFRRKKKHQMANRRQFDTRFAYYEPRPFDFELNGPMPASFQKTNFTNPGMTTYTIPGSQIKVNNIQDILNQGEVMSGDTNNDKSKEINRIQFTGTYRHPKRYNELMGIFSQNYPRSPVVPQPTVYPTVGYYPSSSTQFSSDPFYKYKPRTPSEINLMALNQFRFAPYGPKAPLISSSSSIVPSAAPKIPVKTLTYQPPTYSPYPSTKYLYPINPSQQPPQPSEYENLYHALLNSNHASSVISSSQESSSSSEKRVDGRPKKTKPFSLMLDIYPMTDDDSIVSGVTSTKRPAYRFRRPAQQQPPIYPSGFVNQYIPTGGGDNSYFNSINFPQLQHHRYPNNALYTSIFQSKHRNNNNNNNHFNINQHQHDETDSANGFEKPGQMVVHLNLFPKGNRNRNKNKLNLEYLEERSSEEVNDSNYDGTYDFQPRSLSSDISAEIGFTTNMSLNMGEVLTTIPPSLVNNVTKNIEIIRSIELNATNNFINLDTDLTTNLTKNPIVVIPQLITRNDNNDITDLEFIDHKLQTIPRNHKVDNMSSDLTNFTIDHFDVMRFEPQDVVMKQSERDYFAEHV